jgi:hypothetical protein
MTKGDIEVIISKHDPQGLIRIGAPPDEYEFEASMVFEAMANHNDLISVDRLMDILHSVFVIQFDAVMAGSRDDYRAMAEEIYRG